jgi:DNA-binding beta-propeller fold protein YncE
VRNAAALLLVLILCGSALTLSAAAPALTYTAHPVALPGASERGIAMDYIAFDPATGLLWVPAGNTGAIDVLDTATGKFRQIAGQPTAEMKSGERTRVVGPSSASVGKDVVYVGNRADSTICAFGDRSLSAGKCGHVPSMPDAVVYVGATREVWVTTPRDESLRVLDASTLVEKAAIKLTGAPEGYAVDTKHGRFYTNLEDRDRTLVIDVKTRKTVSDWPSGCGEEGPRGLTYDDADAFLFVACTDKTEVLDVRHGGRILSSIPTGGGVDSVDYSPKDRLLFVGAARAGMLTVIHVDKAGKLSKAAEVATPPGSRNGVVATNGTVYLAHSAGSELVAVSPSKK